MPPIPSVRTARVAALATLALTLALTPDRPRAAEGAAFEVVTLENGLSLLLSPSDAHPVVALSGFVTTGGRTEDEYYQGSLHYIEHLIFKGGTPNLPPTEFRKKMSLLGREAGGYTWDDEINFGFEVPRENFREALETYREALLDLQFEEKWFEDEKRVVIQEMTRRFEEPRRMVYNAWNETAFQVHPYRRPVIGSEKAVVELDLDRTWEYYKERFTPNHMILAISGDFEVEATVALLREVWGGERPGPESFELGLVEPEQTGPRRRVDHAPQATNTHLLVGAVTPGGLHEDTPALVLLAELLEDESYGLSRYLIQQEKWVTSVSAQHYAMRDYSTLRVLARLEPEKAAAVSSFIEAFLCDFDPTIVPAPVFEETRRRLLFEEARARMTNAGRAGRIGFLASRHGIETALHWEESLRAVTPEAVRDAKNRWIGPRRIVTALVHPDTFDPSSSLDRNVEPGAPDAPATPDLAVSGALLPPKTDPLTHEKTDEADGVHRYVYVNGLRLLVRPTDASPLIAVTGRVLGGQWIEPEGMEGINLFTAELGARFTRRWNREEASRLFASLPISLTAHASVGSRANTSMNVDYRDSGAHHVLGLAPQWRESLAVLKETLFFPDFATDELEKLRGDLLDDIRSLPENNLEYIKQQFYVAAYDGHPYGRPTRGTEESLAAITVEDLRRFHRENWTPDRTVVTVVGDVDPDEVAAWIATRWSDLEATESGPRTIDPAAWATEWNPPSDRQVLALGKNYWTVNWGRRGATADDEAWVPSVVLGRMAGNDHFYRYVYGEGVSYRSWIRFWQHLGPGAWIIENDVKRERFDEILAMFDEDLVRYSTTGFEEKEFADAVQRLANAHILDMQNNGRLAWRLARAEGNGLGFRRVTRRADDLRSVSHAVVQDLAKEVFAPEKILRMVQQ
jgi:zinc protease